MPQKTINQKVHKLACVMCLYCRQYTGFQGTQIALGGRVFQTADNVFSELSTCFLTKQNKNLFKCF